MQGSGTFAVEAMIGTFVGPKDKLLILINGAYGKRIAKICRIRQARHARPWNGPRTSRSIPPRCAKTPSPPIKAITHVAVVHCETTSGILNPIVEVSKVVAEAGRKLLVDSMSAFGALPIDVAERHLRRGRRLLQQVHRRRAGPGLRALPHRPR